MTLKYRYYSRTALDLIDFSKEVLKIEKPKLVLWFAKINNYAWKLDLNEIDSFIDFDDNITNKIYLDVRVKLIDQEKILHFYIRGETNENN